MKRQFATIMVALPLVAGSVSLAEDPPMRTTETRTETSQTNQKVMTRRLSKAIGMDVYNQAGKKIGDIKDVVLDGGTNRVSYAVLSYGGVMGMGEKLFAVPWRALSPNPTDNDKLVLNVSEDNLKNAPGFDKDHWPDMANKTFRTQIDGYYGNAGDMKHDMGEMKHDMNNMKHDGAMANDHMKTNDMAKTSDGGKPEVKDDLLWCRRASAVMGADVRNTANENLGDIEDLVVNAQSGKVQYAVLSFGGVLGLGDKLFAIPINALQAKTDDDKFVLDVPKDRLKNAPGFDKKNWPDFADPQFRTSVDDYYSTGRNVTKDPAVKAD